MYDIQNIERLKKMNIKIIEMICPFCSTVHSVKVDAIAYERWQNGVLIQKAMPELSPTEREQLISALCPKCQDNIFGADQK